MNQQSIWFAGFLSVLSGLLLTVGFPFFELYYVAWGALIPLFVAIHGKSGKQAIGLGFLCGLVHFASALYWIRYVVYYYGGLPFPLAILILLLLCAYLALYPALFAYVARIWESRPLLWVFGLPGVWVALEFARAHALTGFPWANLGYTQTPFMQFIQVADLTGVFGVSWLVVLGNTTLMTCLNRSHVRVSLIVLGFCLLGTVAYGTWRLEEIRKLESQAAPWTVGVLQGNIDQSKKWDPAFQQETLRRYRELSLKAAAHSPRPDLLVWPETAAPFFYGLDEKLTKQLTGMFKEAGTPMVFGSPAMSLVEGKPRLQNSAYLVDGNGDLLGAYAKQHLVPFGEYVPLQKMLFFVHRLVQAAGDFVSGHDPSPLKLDGQSLGVLICYEDIFPELSRMSVERGATSLVNITNDAWYGKTSAPYQHMEMARWRAVEFRVPLIRAANTGISTIVDATGRTCGTIPLGEQGLLVCTVRPFRVLSLYARWGDFFAWACVLSTLACVIYSARRRRRDD